MAFGLSDSLKPKLECATLFNRSVRGLSVGSPVNFRGFHVGQISRIALSTGERSGEPSVRVSFYIEPGRLMGEKASEGEARDYIFGQIERGLRVYLSFQGVTGLGFLDLDYEPQTVEHIGQIDFAALKKRAASDGVVIIPNGPGSIMEISESATQIVKSLRGVDFSGLSRDLKSMVETFDRAVANLETDKISRDMRETLGDMQKMSQEISALAGGLSGTFGQNSSRNAGTELAAAVSDLRRSLKRAEQILGASQNNLPAAMENLRVMSENMRELSELLKRYPSQLFFGQPPEAIRR
jgi:ABC-type transporter Mla subunit MlaD